MPIYEYCCQDCRHMFEEWQKDFTDRDMPCPVCGASAKRVISSTAFILKGSGWYATDYARSSANAPGNGQNNGNGGKTESAEAEAGKSGASTSEQTGAAESKTSTSSNESS